jgi:tRNA-2-methylthio-N6-dimethylallyladenosine synthase
MLLTYGCQMNTADSEEMARPLEARGFLPTADLQRADIVLMNTCTVREQAEHRAQSNLGRLRGWKAADPNRVLIVAGCAASRWGDSIKKRYPYIDLVAPATKIEQFPELVEQVLKERWNWQGENEQTFADNWMTRWLDNWKTPNQPVNQSSSHHSTNLFGDSQTAYITIMRGCNYSCSYCIVPQVRGREKYRPLPEILAEVEAKAAQGKTEVMLLGQTVNSYYWKTDTGTRGHGDTGTHQEDISASPLHRVPASGVFDFADLLRAVDAVNGVERIRFMSPHPRHMRDRVIEAMRASAKVCRHIHLPVQSGSSRLLASMNRLYTREEYLAIIQKLRRAMPGLMITTDLIVGFPGETEADFEASLSLMELVAFDGLFAFKFSPRPGTAAAEEPDDVPANAKEARLQQVLALNKHIQRQKPREALSA